MKFLVIVKPKHVVPPEFVIPLIDAFTAWIDKYTESGQLESTWSFPGLVGGGGIANVDSLDELDEILAVYPMAVFQDVEIYPLVGLKESLQKKKQFALTIAQMRGG